MTRSALLAFVLLGSVAQAHESGELAEWYRSLTNANGGSCCNSHDCLPTDARLEGDHWRVPSGNAWEDVPPEAILKRENMEGRAVVCRYGGRIMCFVPAAGV